MAFDGSLIFDTKINREGFEKGVNGLKSAGQKAFGALTKVVAGTATAIAGIGIASAKVGSGFEADMSQVAATMGISVDEITKGSDAFDKLEASAKQMGRDTQFSAGESAEALNYLALAGYDADKAVDALPKVLDLAAAGGLDLAYASDLVTDSMSALGMETDELDGFVDELAKTSQKSNTNVGQLGEAILNIGGTAKIMKGGTTELNTQLGILADNGIKGSEGGTALRNVLLSLSAPTDKQAAAMEQLGVETYDANGNLRSTDDIFQDLDGTLGEMTDEEKTEVLSNLFNKVDLKAANALLDGSGERFAELSNEIGNAEGSAELMAETLNDNLKGKITILESALQGLGIEIYQSMQEPLKGVTETAIDMIGELTNAFDEGGFEGLVEAVGSMLAEILEKFAEQVPKFVEMAVSLISAFIEGIQENKDTLVESAVEIVTTLVEAFFELFPDIIVLGMDLMMAFAEGMIEELPSIIEAGQEMIMSLVEYITENLPEMLEMGMEILASLILGIVEMLPELIPMAIELILNLVEALIDNIDLLIDASIAIIMAIAEGLIESIPVLIEKAPIIINKLIDAIVENAGMLVKASIELIFQLGAGLIGEIPNLVKNIPEIVKAVLNAFTLGFKAIKEIGINVIKGLWNGASSAKDWVVDKFKGVGSSIINGVKGIFKTKSPSQVMAGIGKNVVAGMGEGIDNNQNITQASMKGMSKGILDEFSTLEKAVLKALSKQFTAENKARASHIKDVIKQQAKDNGAEVKELEKHGEAKIKALKAHYANEIKEMQTHFRNILTELNKHFIAEIGAMKTHYSNLIKEYKTFSSKEIEEMKAHFVKVISALETHHAKIITDLEGHNKKYVGVLEIHYGNVVTALETHHRAIITAMETHQGNVITQLQAQGEAVKSEDEAQHTARHTLLGENMDALITLLETYYPDWYNAGEQFGQNMLDGIKSMKDAIKDEVDIIANYLEQAEKDYNAAVDLRQQSKDEHDAMLEEKEEFEKEFEKDANATIKSGNTRMGLDMQSASTSNISSTSLIQNITFKGDETSPSENSRKIKNVGRELLWI